MDFAEAGGPAGGVVREDAAGEPGGVGEEPSRGAAAQAVVFEVSDGELDGGVVSVVGIGCFGVEVVSVGDEAVVAPVGPQLALRAEQAAAPRDEPQLGGFGVAAAAASFDGGLSHLASPPRVYAIAFQASSPMASWLL